MASATDRFDFCRHGQRTCGCALLGHLYNANPNMPAEAYPCNSCPFFTPVVGKALPAAPVRDWHLKSARYGKWLTFAEAVALAPSTVLGVPITPEDPIGTVAFNYDESGMGLYITKEA